jgi:hypothetical protein
VCREISEDKIAVCEKTAGLRSGNFSNLNSACSKVLVPVKIFQFQDMGNENRFLGTFRGHSKRPKVIVCMCMCTDGVVRHCPYCCADDFRSGTALQ